MRGPKKQRLTPFQLKQRGILRGFAIGFLVTVALVAAKWGLEQTSLGHRLELLAYEFLHKRLSPYDPSQPLPIVVLDTSRIKGGKDGTVTSRKQLEGLVDALLSTDPRAILIDMNFSPSRTQGLEGEDDFAFFDSLIEKRKRWGVPILIGVSREAVVSGDADLWLGGKEYNELAASMDINDNDTTKLPYGIKCGANELLSFSGALALGQNEKHPPPIILKPLLYDLKMPAEACGEKCVCSYLTVNYAKLETIEAQSLPIITIDAIVNAEHKFRNRIVILGDGVLERAEDPFDVVGRTKPVPGVYLHAAAIYTLIAEPLYRFTLLGRIVIDFSIALFILSLVSIRRWRNLDDETFPHHQRQSLFIKLAVVTVLVGGVLMIRLLHIIWLDFVLVVAALLLHQSAESWVSRVWNFVRPGEASAKALPKRAVKG